MARTMAATHNLFDPCSAESHRPQRALSEWVRAERRQKTRCLEPGYDPSDSILDIEREQE